MEPENDAPAPDISLPEYQKVAEALVRNIHTGIFPPGTCLPSERDLATLLGAGQPAVREALIALEIQERISLQESGEILVCPEPETGSSPTDDENSPQEQLQARILLEGEIASLAAVNASADDLKVLQALLVVMAGSINDRARFLEADREFHHAVARASGNRVLLDLVRFLWLQRRLPVYRALEKHFTREDEQRIVLAEHTAIFAALGAHDPHAARAEMRRHIERVRNQLLR